ncbi:MAG: YegP family protein [Sandaracinaceae bacterium]
MRTSTTALVALALVALANGCAMERDPAAGAAGSLSARPYFEVWQSESGDHYFHLNAGNHETILASQAYSSRTAALAGVLSVLDNGEISSRYELRTARNGQTYFVLKAANGQVIGTSETYSTRSNGSRGVRAATSNVSQYIDWLAERAGARLDVFRGNDGQYYFNLHAANGEIVLSSEGYSSEAAAYNATFALVENGLTPDAFVVSQSRDGGAYFNVVAQNGEIIATSEVYASMSNARRAVNSVMELLEVVELL